jgi:hypothetical protein
MRIEKRYPMGARSDYFAVNAKPMGVRTSYTVSGRLGECRRAFPLYRGEADRYCRALNRAYELGARCHETTGKK